MLAWLLGVYGSPTTNTPKSYSLLPLLQFNEIEKLIEEDLLENSKPSYNNNHRHYDKDKDMLTHSNIKRKLT